MVDELTSTTLSLHMAVIQSLSCVWLVATPWTAARQAFLSFTISWSLLTLVSIESVMPSNHLILCHPLLLLPSTFPSLRVLLMSPFFLFASGGRSTGASVSASVLPVNIRIDFLQDWLVWSPCSCWLKQMYSLRVVSGVLFGAQWGLQSRRQHHSRLWETAPKQHWGKSIYEVLVQEGFSAMKHSFHKSFFVSCEDLRSPWRDLVLL